METSRLPTVREPSLNGQRNATAPATGKKKGRSRIVPVSGAIIVLVGAAAAWHFLGTHGNSAPSAAANTAPAPVAVNVQTITPQKLRLWNDFSGRLRAIDAAEIRPEVSGRITEVRFHDGQSVKAGDILLVIEPLPFEAAEARAEAGIASAKANLHLAAANHSRNVDLLHTRVIAQSEFDATDSANNAAAAAVLVAQADLKTARVDLDHAYVKAPISGRVSRAELTVGNFVQNGAAAPLLTSIVSENGIYADFEVDEQTYLSTIRDAANGNVQEGKIPVELTVPGDTGQTYRGFIQNFDNQIDSRSGTIRARARFDNADAALVPGMFVSVRLASSRERALMMIPDRAINFDQSKKFVFVVLADNKAAYREVELGRELGGQWVVSKGLNPGDRVIVDGIQRVHADVLVSPQETAPPVPVADDNAMKSAQASDTQQNGNSR